MRNNNLLHVEGDIFRLFVLLCLPVSLSVFVDIFLSVYLSLNIPKIQRCFVGMTNMYFHNTKAQKSFSR